MDSHPSATRAASAEPDGGLAVASLSHPFGAPHLADVEQSQYLRAVLEAAPECIKVVARDGTLLDMNAAGLAIIDAPDLAAVRGRCVFPLVAEADRDAFRRATEAACDGVESRYVFEMATLAGRRRRVEARTVPLRDAHGTVIAALSVTRDVTDAHAAELEMRREAQLRETLLESAYEGICTTDATGTITFANPRLAAMLGWSLPELRGRPLFDLMDADKAFDERTRFARRQRGIAESREVALRRKDGTPLTVNESVSSLFAPDGAFAGAVILFADLTERARAEAALADALEAARASEASFRASFDAMPGSMGIIDPETARFVDFNDSACAQLGYTRAEFARLTIPDIDADDDRAAVLAIVAAGAVREETLQIRRQHRTKTGELREVLITSRPFDAGSGRRLSYCTWIDVTAQVRTEAIARAQSAVLDTVLANIPLMVALLDATGRFEWVNREWERVLGWPVSDMRGRDMVAEFFPDARLRDEAVAFMSAAPREWRRFPTRARDGSDVVAAWISIRLPDGRMIGIGRDDRSLVAAEAARAQLEERLRQAQKMEAVGQLAGGVAHDFNNLLTVISGSLEFLRADLPADHPVRPDVEEIGHAAERARTLVRQLLTLSRKQPIRPRQVRMRELVSGAEKLLRRVIGEEILLEVHVDERATVHADPGQLEQVLMNLAVNARDAMLTPLHGHHGIGGTLAIEVDEIVLASSDARRWDGMRPGRWVRLRVRDSGHGMDEETRAHAFEPFFTTKAVGAGTGLGLATVFGIVRQAGGAIRVDSAPGQGATFTILLPSVPTAAGADDVAPASVPTAPRRATVLLVEDETAVRATARRMLERRGYSVIEARHGADALLLWRAHHATIDCVVTDLRMPEMGGRELVALLRGDTPWLPVVFVSGYSDRGLIVARDAREAFVEKPFAAETLLAAVRGVMDGDDVPRGAG